MKGTKLFAILGATSLVAAMALEGVAAAAPEARVRCEVRGTSRSKVSVDGKNLPRGTYAVTVTSGANAASVKKGVAGGANDEFEADFDSNPADVRAGATPISRTFITNRRVTATISGPVKITVANVLCRAR